MTLTKSFAIAAAMLLSTAANAGTINVTPSDIGNSFTVGFDGFANDSVIDGLSAEATFTLTEATGSSYTFDYDIANTSGGAIDASRVSIFGFNTDPTISGATSTGLFSEVNTNANVPSGFGQVDVCFKGSGEGNSCSGGGGTGVWMGDSTSGSFTLTFDQAIDQLSLSDLFVRYQSIEGANAPGSAIGRGTVSSSSGGSTSTGGSTGGTPVPAPAALWLFAAGIAGLGWQFGRKGAARLPEARFA